MGLRLSTAMMLVTSLGLVAACGEDEADVADAEVVVEEGVADAGDAIGDAADATGDAVVDGADAVGDAVTPDAPIVAGDDAIEEIEVDEDTAVVAVDEVEPEADADVIAEAGGADPIELETTVESDGEPITATTETDVEADVAGADPALDDATAVVVEETDDAAADVAADVTEEPVELDAEIAAADTGTAAVVEQAPATDEAGDGLITLDTNVTTVPSGATTEQDVEQAATGDLDATEGDIDAEAQVDPAAPEDAQVEATNDVATDGIDSGSEANMLDLDNLVLDDEGVQSLTEYVEASEQISATQKITLVAGLDAARDDPERLEEILQQIRDLTAQ